MVEKLEKKNKMKKQNKQIEEIKKKILPILKANKIKKAGIFGSFARGEQKEDSDVDILIEVQKGWSLLDVIGLELELKKILMKEVDLLTYNGVHPLLRERILQEEVKII